MAEKVRLGTKVRDSITGFEGTVTARCEYLTSTTRIMIEGQSADGKPVDLWCDESRAELRGE